MMIFVLLLLSSLYCPLHAQDFSTSDGSITSETDNVTDGIQVVISAPWAIFSKSLYVFTTGIPIQPTYIQAPSGLSVWMTIQCKGGAARVTVPNFVANFSMVQTDPSGEWVLPPLPRNALWPVTGLGIKFYQNVSICNDALETLMYGKGADNDIAGKAAMTITLNWNATSTRTNAVVILTASTTIYIWAPTALTNLSTFQATVAVVCLVGILGLCCLGCLNSVGVKYFRRYNVLIAKLTQDEQECEQNRVFNPLWIPCAPSQPGYYHISSTSNSLILVQRRMEIKRLILRVPTAFSLMDRLLRVKYLKSSNYGLFGFELPCGATPLRPQDSSSDDELPPGLQKARPRSRISRVQAEHLDLARQQQRSPSFVRFSPQFVPQAYAQQRAPSYNWQQLQAQAHAQAKTEAQAQVLAETEAQAQGATNYNQSPMYADSANYPRQITMYPGYQYSTDQYPRSRGNGQNYETITVGHAFIHQMFAERVPTHSLPSCAMVCMLEQRQGKDTSCEENLIYEQICGAQGSHNALPESRKGKEPMRLETTLEQFEARGSFEMEHTICQRISLDSASNSNSYCCHLEEVTENLLERRFGGLEGGVSELLHVVVPNEELTTEQGSQSSNRASECYGSPMSDIYEDFLGSCSPTNSFPAQIDAESPIYGKETRCDKEAFE